MPEPEPQAGQGTQTVESASTPASTPAQDKQPTTTTVEQKTAPGLMDLLDIPPELQERLAPKAEEPAAQAEAPPAQTGAAAETPAATEEQDEDSDDEPDEETSPPAAEGPKPDKRDKRIKRLTRQKWEAEKKADQLFQLAQEQQAKLEAFEGKGGPQGPMIPSGTGRLAYVTDERQLGQEVAKAESIIDWCDQNAEGATTGTGENEKYIDAAEITRWRRQAEKVVLSAPQRRDEIRSFHAQRAHFDGLAQDLWPAIFDESSEQHQIAQAILAQFPVIRDSPQAHYAVGLVIEGAMSLEKRAPKGAQPNGGEPKVRRDISPRAFEPRVPIAPATPAPPSREATPSLRKQVNEAMSNLVNDPDGSAASLAAAFAAMDKAKRSTADSRSPVKV